MYDTLIIVSCGFIIGLILIYFKQQLIDNKSSLDNQRISNKTRNEIKLQQSLNQQSSQTQVSQNKIVNEKLIQNWQYPQKVQKYNRKEENQVNNRFQSDQKLTKMNIIQEKQDLSSVKSIEDRSIQQTEEFDLIPALPIPEDRQQKASQLFSNQPQNFQEPFKKQQIIQTAQVENNNHYGISNNQIVKQQIFNLYNMSCRSRKRDAKFLGPAIIQKNYSDLYVGDEIKQQLNLFLRGYRKVRGDGNCYFTAIAFQYFEILLNKYNYLEFREFINQIQTMDFQIEFNGYFIEATLQNQFAQRMAELLQILRDNPSQLEQMMADPNHEFYGNLAHLLYLRQNSQIIVEYKPDLSYELLTWEFQCNDSEMINSSLAKYLNIIINVYLIDQKNIEVTQLKYGQQSKNEIHLIYIPGHYDIGIPL